MLDEETPVKRSSRIAAFVLLPALFVIGVVGTIARYSIDDSSTLNTSQVQSADEERKRLADETASREAQRLQAEKARQEREAAAKSETDQLAKQKEDEKRQRESERLAEVRRTEQEAESKRVAAEVRARETVAREKRRRGLLANRAIPTTRYNAIMCAEKSAADFEILFFADAPSAKAAIHYFDVSTADGSLIVHLAVEAADGSAADLKSATDAVVRAWRESKYTQSNGFSKTVEFRRGDAILFTDEG
jgi:hypothetical protein